MEAAKIISLIGITLLVAKVAEEVVLKIGFPSLLGPLGVGLMMSKLTIIKEEYNYAPLLFVAGLNFTAFLLGSEELGSLLRDVRGEHVYKGFVAFFVPFFVAYASLEQGLSSSEALLLSATFAMPSTLRIYSILRHVELENFEEILIISSVSEIIGITLILLMAVENYVELVIIFVSILILLKYGRKAFRKLLEAEEAFLAREFPLAVLISAILSLGYASEVLGFNSAATSLFLGIISSEYLVERPWILNKLKTINHSLFEPLFFVGSGALVQFNLIDLRTFLILAVANFVVIMIRSAMVKRWSGWRWRHSLLATVKGGIDTALMASQYKIHKLTTDTYSSAITIITLNTFLLGSLAIVKKTKRGAFTFCDFELIRAAVELSEPLEDALKIFESGIDAVVVVDLSNWPVGYLLAADVVGLKEEDLKKMKVYEVYREGVPVFRCEDKVSRVITLDEEIEKYPVVAVVKEGIGYFGSVYTSAVLKKLAEELS